MNRRFFTLYRILSLLLGATTCVMWARSYRAAGGFSLPCSESLYFASANGNFTVGWSPPDPRFSIIFHLRPRSEHRFVVGFFWSEWLDQNYSAWLKYPVGTTASWEFGLHDWFLVLVFALPETCCLIAIALHERQMATGLCPHCGYDLRATPVRCPECGTVASGGRA
jgi:hypothetical protein